MQSDRVRAIDPSTGIIRTIAGSGGRAYGGDNGPATEAYFLNPYDVSVDRSGRVVVADTLNGRVRRVDKNGVVHTVAGTGESADRGDGGPAAGAGLTVVWSVTHGPDGAIYLGDAAGRIRRVDADTRRISTVAGIGIQGYTGDGSPATAARIGSPSVHFGLMQREISISLTSPTTSCAGWGPKVLSQPLWVAVRLGFPPMAHLP